MDPHAAGDLHDETLSDEIRLLGEVVLAASGFSRHLTDDEVDELLHVHGAWPRSPDGDMMRG